MSVPACGTFPIAADPAAWLVAHRGDQTAAAENTLPAFKAAADAGARFIECDIQFDKELQPLVFHDHHLGRLFGRADLRLANHAATELANLQPGFIPLPLIELLDWLDTQPQLTLFLEIKPNVLSRHRPGVIARLLAPLLARPAGERIVVISQSSVMMEACARYLPQRYGWVMTEHRRPTCNLSHVFLEEHSCAFMVGWKSEGVCVVVYTVNEIDEAKYLLAAGADLVETNHFARLCRGLADG